MHLEGALLQANHSQSSAYHGGSSNQMNYMQYRQCSYIDVPFWYNIHTRLPYHTVLEYLNCLYKSLLKFSDPSMPLRRTYKPRMMTVIKWEEFQK